ncbi:MAG: hypothetical protein ACJAV4_000523 [Pontimonas sp.]|jgi:hypothetical protein
MRNLRVLQRIIVGSTACVLLLSGCASADESSADDAPLAGSSPEESGGNLVSILSLNLGDCVLDPALPAGSDEAVVKVVKCSEPHDWELFAKLSLTEARYPGTSNVIAQGEDRCQSSFGNFIGVNFSESSLEFTFYYPTPSSWVDGDRSIYCMAFDPGLRTTGSLLGANR